MTSSASEARISLNHVPTVIGISGPPRAGKDTFAGYLHDALSKAGQTVYVHRMSHPLKLLASQMLPDQKWAVESLKDEPMNSQGTTYREIQIQLFHLGSALFDSSWLGRHYLNAILAYKRAHFLLMPDCGRLADIQPLLDMEVPFFRIRISREGTTFEGDSREDFEFEGTIEVPNNGPLFHLQGWAKAVATSLLTHTSGVVTIKGLTP